VLCLLIDVFKLIERPFCFKWQTLCVLQHGGLYLMTMDTEWYGM